MATIRAVMTQDLTQLLRSFFLYLPIAIIGTFVAVFLAQSLLTVTDALSEAVAQGVAGDVSHIFDSVGKTLSDWVGAASPSTPSFAIFFAALLLIVASFFVWLELLIRSAALTVCVFFLPLILASLVWPATARWTKRMIEILVALILSKFVIVAVISLATAALSDPGSGGFGTVMGGAALMVMAAFSPFALLKLMPVVEGAAIDHLQGLGRRPLEATTRTTSSVNHAVSVMRSKMSSGRGNGLAVAGAHGRGSVAGGAGAAATAGLAAARGAKATARAPGKRLEKQADATRPAAGDGKRSQPTSKAGRGGSMSPSVRPPKKEEPPK